MFLIKYKLFVSLELTTLKEKDPLFSKQLRQNPESCIFFFFLYLSYVIPRVHLTLD